MARLRLPIFRKKTDNDNVFSRDSRKMLGPNLSFSASEAYKLLRTNTILSMPNNSKCKVIGVTSRDESEGKSTTSINLAYSLAENNKTVLLVESDLRRPTIAKRLNIRQTPGITNLLAGMDSSQDCFKGTSLSDNITILTAGTIPPNPSELLASDEMADLIDVCKENFDYIILDLPPVNIVTDALVVANIVDGMIMVARADYRKKSRIRDALRQLEFSKVKVLGFVLTNTNIASKSYSRYGGKYGKYYRYGDYSQSSKEE